MRVLRPLIMQEETLPPAALHTGLLRPGMSQLASPSHTPCTCTLPPRSFILSHDGSALGAALLAAAAVAAPVPAAAPGLGSPAKAATQVCGALAAIAMKPGQSIESALSDCLKHV